MAFFGKDHSKDLAYLNSEREKAWERIEQLEKLVAERPSDLEKEAKEASRQTSKFRNRARETKEEADHLLDSIKAIKADFEEMQSLLEANEVALNAQISVAESSAETLSNLEVATNAKVTVIESKIQKVEAVFDAHPELETEVDGLDDTIAKVNQSSSKVTAILRNAAARKAEIDELYYEIAGSEETDEETGETIISEGLRATLENQYEKLEEDLKNKRAELIALRDQAADNFSTFHEEKSEEAEEHIAGWKTKYAAYEQTINDLIPTALTAGLSGAFHDKKTEEQQAFTMLQWQFISGIIGLVLVSLIPFGLSYSFLLEGISWDVIIDRGWRSVLMISPLYIPVLWLAFSAKKKMNLSKRLIEEYSHKEVMSRTFYGLSNQIENTDDLGIANELRTRLLMQFLTVSAENPGKLISDYESSDHPLMEVLERYGLDRLAGKKAKAVIAPNGEALSSAKKVVSHAKKAADAVVDAVEDLGGK